MKNSRFTPHQKTETGSTHINTYGAGFIEWPDISFEELKGYYVENKAARIMYQGLIALLFMPEILIRSFHEVLKFKV